MASPPALVGTGLEVPLVTGSTVARVNLDFAATTPAMQVVADAIANFLPWYGSVHRGGGFASEVATDLYYSARTEIAAFVNARSDDVVVFTRNTTDGLNLLANCLEPDAKVVTFDSEHHANLLPWRWRTCVHLPAPASADEALSAADKALAKLRRGQKLLSITAASNVTGERWPIKEFAALAHRHGARLMVDAAQLAAHAPIDLVAWDADWVAFSGHKIYAPFGCGALIGRSDWLTEGRPYLAGGGAVRLVTADSVLWTDAPERHEAGTPNPVGAVALATSLHTLRSIGMDELDRHETDLLAYACEQLATIPSWSRYTLWEDPYPRVPVVVFNLPGYPHELLAAVLAAEFGVDVRSGAMCAHPLVYRLLNWESPDLSPEGKSGFTRRLSDPGVGARPGALRASLGIATTREDIDALVSALDLIVKNGPAWTYRFDGQTGRCAPDPDPRPRPFELGLGDSSVGVAS